MKANKLLAALVVLLVAVPGAAYAATTETSEIVEGHTVFAAVVEDDATTFAAIAGIAAKRTTVGGVLWFNDQELIPSTVASELAAGKFVIATEAGDDAPSEHLDADYTESYQFMDPNDRVWLVDRYTYNVCSVEVAGGFHPVPCEETQGLNNDTELDLDQNGDPDVDSGDPIDLDGDGTPEYDGSDPIIVVTKSVYVVTIGETTVDGASTCATAATGKEYNFVLIVRMDALQNATLGGKAHGPSATDSNLAGNSHAASSDLDAVDDHTHDTAQIDLWYSDDRPAEPPVRSMLFADTVGAAGACHDHA